MNNHLCRFLPLLCCLGVFFSASIYAEEKKYDGLLAERNFSATFTLASDYIFRGTSFTSEDPAVQGSFDWGYAGFYTGVWSSNIDLSPASQEIDLYGGYAASLDGIFDYDFMGIYYYFPDADSDPEPDYWEWSLSLARTFTEIQLQPTIGAMIAYTPDFSLEDGNGVYLKGTLGFLLPGDFGLDFGAGYQGVAGDRSTRGWDYAHWEAGATKSWEGFDFDLRYHDTNVDENDTYLTFLNVTDTKNVDARVVFTVSRSF